MAEQLAEQATAEKRMVNGQIVIVKNNESYTVLGNRIR